MFGIVGWVGFEHDIREKRALVEEMTATMRYRGPDDSGTYVDAHVGFGHRRLALIDLSGGRQPMSVPTPSGDVAIVYSGESYNFRELRAELAGLGHSFDTDSGTEVVLHGYLQWGAAVAERLNGMYAFAV